jgi:hypothetical protein
VILVLRPKFSVYAVSSSNRAERFSGSSITTDCPEKTSTE